jgi:hypothetical protein
MNLYSATRGPAVKQRPLWRFGVRFGGGVGADVTNERARRRTQTSSQVRQAPANGECRQKDVREEVSITPARIKVIRHITLK